ncbi:hypothetical protein DFJ74DRAFT_665317 [Hyaloraphidium curvatum]|nr:hypothetical protein DFJ74DRAFT_665317 [Hyaloraphidium curvatum]
MSVVDFLKDQGRDSSFGARKKLFEAEFPEATYGFGAYTGTEDQNLALLARLNGQPAALTHLVGKDRYYTARAADFSKRNTAKAVPYYLDYGAKYQARFLDLRASLSPHAQAWLDATHEGLQRAIEDRLRNGGPDAFAALERDAEAFRAFCFETHAGCYVDAGICELSPADWGRIFVVPDAKDLFTKDGLRQALDVGRQCAPVVLERIKRLLYQ